MGIIKINCYYASLNIDIDKECEVKVYIVNMLDATLRTLSSFSAYIVT